LSAIVLLASLLGCDKATRPKDVRYNLYVGATHLATSPEDSSFNRIYIYDADSLTLLDSIWQAHFTENLAVSPDGQWLYVLDFTTQSVPRMLWRIDARTKQVAWSRSDFGGGGGYAYIRLLRDGALLLVGNTVVRPEDGSAVRTFTDSMFAMWGPVPRTKVAAIVRGQPLWHGNDSLVKVLDVATGELSGYFVPHLKSGVALQEIYTVRLHPDGKRVLAIGVYGSVYNSWFVVGDVVTGQTLFEYQISYPHGEIAISSDGNLAAFTDPGTPSFGEGGIPRMIDLRTYRVTEPPPAGVGARDLPIMGSQVRFLPGERRIVTAPAADASLSDGGPLQVIDVATMTLEKTIWPTFYDSLNWQPVGCIGIGPRP
jgi:DNA-binding beta-propeller fold protein YncE